MGNTLFVLDLQADNEPTTFSGNFLELSLRLLAQIDIWPSDFKPTNTIFRDEKIRQTESSKFFSKVPGNWLSS